MSVVYRIVQRCVFGDAEDKELERGTVASLNEVVDNTTIIVKRSTRRPAPCLYVYDLEVWITDTSGVGFWFRYMPLIPYVDAPSKVSMDSCFTSADVPLVAEDAPTFTANDIPLSGADITIPYPIAPAATYV